MMTPGEEAILAILVAATVLLFDFSMLSATSAVEQEALRKAEFLRADKAADLLRNGAPPEPLASGNTSIWADGRQYGGKEGSRYTEASRFSYAGGRLVRVRVRVW